MVPGAAEQVQHAASGVRAGRRTQRAAPTADTFARGFGQAFWYQVALFLLTLALVRRLPRANPRQLARPAGPTT